MGKENKQYYRNIPYNGGLLVHCPNCEAEGEPVYRLGGKMWINIILLILGIFPGILYLIRRCMNCVCLCKKCHHEELGEINGESDLIVKLKKIQCRQNIYYLFVVFVFVLIILDIIIRLN